MITEYDLPLVMSTFLVAVLAALFLRGAVPVKNPFALIHRDRANFLEPSSSMGEEPLNLAIKEISQFVHMGTDSELVLRGQNLSS